MKLLSQILARIRGFAFAHWLDVIVIAVGVSAGLVAFWAVAHAPLDVGPIRLDVSVAPSVEPRTVVQVPPFGTVSATTHKGPVELRLRVDEIDVEGTRDLITSTTTTEAAEVLQGRIPSELQPRRLPQAVVRILGIGLAAALAACVLVTVAMRRSRWMVAIASAIMIVIVIAPLGVAASTWDAKGFREPTLRGGLSYAPWLVDVFSTRVADIERLRDQAEKVARDLAGYYADERTLAAGGTLAGTYRVLHVTDMHLDPVGAVLAEEIARSYDVSLVIDTGDMAILGLPFEGRAIESLIGTSTPRVYVPGNHDSVATVETLRSIPQVTVIESGTVEVDGLRIFGVPDPFSRGFGIEPLAEPIEQATAAAEEEFSEALRSGEPTPNIVAIHNPAMEKPFIGQVPVILSGHTHSARAYVSQGTLRLNSGTIGGMPYDPETSNRKVVPYGASVLYYSATLPRRLIAVDELAVSSDRSTTVRRMTLEDRLIP